MSSSVMMSPEITNVYASNNVNIYKISTNKFKTNSISFFFLDNLDREHATKNALIPAILRRGTKQHPTLREISLALQELYGATFDCGVSKKGEIHIIQFYIEFVSEKYTIDKKSLYKKGVELLNNIIFDPLLVNNQFKEEYFNQEKENLASLINGRINNKMAYAIERCFEEMCREETFSIYEYGTLEDLNNITITELSEYYKKMAETFPINIYITGDFDSEILDYIINRIEFYRKHTTEYQLKRPVADAKNNQSVKYISEKQDVNQGKLTLGYRTHIQADQPAYYRLLVYNSILGGGIHSKLFKNVREKSGLAYYIFSTIEKFKGLMIITCGIEFESKQQTEKIIKHQLDELKNGFVTDDEFNAALKNIKSGIEALKDNHLLIVDYYLGQFIAGTDDSFDALINKVSTVKKDEIVDIASKISLDTVYFLETK